VSEREDNNIDIYMVTGLIFKSKNMPFTPYYPAVEAHQRPACASATNPICASNSLVFS
jgi:hypothetical protein